MKKCLCFSAHYRQNCKTTIAMPFQFYIVNKAQFRFAITVLVCVLYSYKRYTDTLFYINYSITGQTGQDQRLCLDYCPSQSEINRGAGRPVSIQCWASHPRRHFVGKAFVFLRAPTSRCTLPQATTLL